MYKVLTVRETGSIWRLKGTVWLGLRLGKEWRETDRGQGGAVHAGL